MDFKIWVRVIITLAIIFSLMPISSLALAASSIAPLPQTQEVCFDDICLDFDSQLGFVDAIWVDGSEVVGRFIPGHIEFMFHRFQFDAPDNYFGGISFYSTNEVDISEIEWTLTNQPFISPSIYENISGVRRLPFPDGNAMLGLIGGFNYLDFFSGTGYRYIGQYVQATFPVDPYDLVYIYQGLSSDQNYVVSAYLNIDLPIDPGLSRPGEFSDESLVRSYNQQWAEIIDQASSYDFSPDIALLDTMMQSIRIGYVQPPYVPRDIPTDIPPEFYPQVDPGEVQIWLDEKTSLTQKMENMIIPTRLFDLPGVKAYKEDAAVQLVENFSAQLSNGYFTLDELERLKRLTIQERALYAFLPEYVETTSTVANPLVDIIMTTLSFNKALEKVWKGCGGTICWKLNRATEKTTYRIIRNLGKQFIRVGADKIDTPEAMEKMFNIGLMAVEEKIGRNEPLKDLLVDTAMETFFTGVMIQPYLSRTQKMLDLGVDTASGDVAYGYPITADSKRADSLTKELILKAGWESDLAVSRYQDFSRAADIAQIAQDVSDLASIGNPIFASVSLGVRFEKLLVNYFQMMINVDQMGCIEYLADRASEMAFDAEQPSDDCRYWRADNLQFSNSLNISSSSLQRFNSFYHKAVFQESDQYRSSLNGLKDAIQGRDLSTIYAAIDQFIIAENELAKSLEKSRSIIWSQEEPTLSGIEFISQTSGHDAMQTALFLAMAENATALELQKMPEVNFSEIVETALSQLDQVEQAIQKVDLTPPMGKVILLIREAEFGESSNGKLPLQVKIMNQGDIPAPSLSIVLEGGPSPQTIGGSLLAQEEGVFSFDTELISETIYTVKVYSEGQLADFVMLSSPNIEVNQSIIDGSKILSNGNNLLIIGLCAISAGILVLIAMVIVFFSRNRRRNTYS